MSLNFFQGRGGKDGALQKCNTCKGSGVQVRLLQLGPGMIQQTHSTCQDCQGQGEVSFVYIKLQKFSKITQVPTYL